MNNLRLPFGILFLLVSLQVICSTDATPCLMDYNPGFCKGSFTRWYFDRTSETCKSFIWGGCGGSVPFKTKTDCLRAQCPENACVLEPNPGPCRAAIRRWYFDKRLGSCRMFIYGGCGGVVPFRSLELCEQANCNSACTQRPRTGPCRARFIRFFFNKKTGKCAKFTWGGCYGSVPFKTLSQCESAKCNALARPTPSPSSTPSSSPSPSASPIPEVCLQKPDPGFCKAYVPSYYWDNDEVKCKRFIWGGCGGQRPFKTKVECENAGCKNKCSVKRSDVEPSPDLVTCQAFWTSWYYDPKEKTCKSFSYSGCSHLGPFTNKEECESDCAH